MSSVFNSITSFFPQHPGILPKWLFFISVVSILNSVQAYTTLSYTGRVYSGSRKPSGSFKPGTAYPTTSPVTPLSGRLFGTWTMVQSVVRMYAAYNIDNPQIYQMAYWTYVIAFAHFMAEWRVYKSTTWALPLAFPVCIAAATLVWMPIQWGFYVK